MQKNKELLEINFIDLLVKLTVPFSDDEDNMDSPII